jgi:hypothetical protein
MKTSIEQKLIVDLDWEERYLAELEQMGSVEQIELQQKAVSKAICKLDNYYLNLKEVH